MSSFRSEIELKPSRATINHSARLMLVGSCFSTNVGQRLLDHKFTSLVNPFGVLYNPLSIAECLQLLIDNKPCTEDDLVQHNGLWHSWLHHGSFSHATAQDCLAQVNTSLHDAVLFLQNTTHLLVTFGTARVYRLRDSQRVVANCHKIPARQFVNEQVSIDEIVVTWQALIEALRTINPELQIIFTVSPIRHWKDGAHDNQLSKAILLLAIDALQKQNENVEYFPAYELFMDDLRDYRFYEADMFHPSAVAIDYVWQKFGSMFFTSPTIQLNARIKEVLQACGHRPLHGNTPEYRSFVEAIFRKMDLLEQQQPSVSFASERKLLELKLSNELIL